MVCVDYVIALCKKVAISLKLKKKHITNGTADPSCGQLYIQYKTSYAFNVAQMCGFHVKYEDTLLNTLGNKKKSHQAAEDRTIFSLAIVFTQSIYLTVRSLLSHMRICVKPTSTTL